MIKKLILILLFVCLNTFVKAEIGYEANEAEITGITSSSSTTNATVYQATPFAVISDSATSKNEVFQNSIIRADERYSGFNSTGTMDRVTSIGIIINTPELITDYGFYVQGGDAEVSFSGKSGTLFLYDGIPVYTIFTIPLLNNTVNITSLTPGATCNYDINGGNQ